MPEGEKVRNCINAALDWFQQHDLRPVKIEEAQYSRLHKICGRADWIGYVDGTFSVLDYKSTRQLWPEISLQMSAYASLHGEEFGQLPATRWGLRLDKESGAFEAKQYKAEDFAIDWDTFLCCFKIYDRMKTLRRKPKKEDYLFGL